MGNPVEKPYMVQTTIDFGHADLDALVQAILLKLFLYQVILLTAEQR